MNSQSEESKIDEATSLSAEIVYDVVRQEGEEELKRGNSTLFWSGVAAGIMISLSVLGKAVLTHYLPDAEWTHLVTSFGYTLGFVAVIMGRMQLFTENTITTVLPYLCNPSRSLAFRIAKLWSIVLFANVIGAFAVSTFYQYSGAIDESILKEMHKISEHAMEMGVLESFVRAIPSGVLVACLVWMLPEAKSSALWIIVMFTWMIAAGDFAHIVAGSVEMSLLMVSGSLGLIEAVVGFFIPVLVGNVVGGTVIFASLAYGQVNDRIKRSE